MKISVVGVGSLGSALVKALLDGGCIGKNSLTLYNRSMTDFLRQLQSEGVEVKGPRVFEDPNCESDVIVVAVKPQEAEAALAPWAKKIKSSTVVLSVMAGVQIGAISQFLSDHPTIVRAMPNLGAYVGKSATAYFAPTEIGDEAKESVCKVLSAFGTTYEVLEEVMLDAATAIAGSGPAYLCWLAEQMISSAVEFGFERAQAIDMVVQTLVGTSELLQKRGGEPSIVREQVTSRGGTTAAALTVLKDVNAEVFFERALRAAEVRSRELSHLLSGRT